MLQPIMYIEIIKTILDALDPPPLNYKANQFHIHAVYETTWEWACHWVISILCIIM